MLATGRRCSKKLKTRPLHGLLSTEEELSSRVGLHTGRDLLQQHPVSSIQPLLLALTNKLVFIQLPVPRVSEFAQQHMQLTHQTTWHCDAAAPPTQQSMHWRGTSTALA